MRNGPLVKEIAVQVAIIGGTGFVGGYIVDALLQAGHVPSVLVRPGSEGKLRRSSDCRVTSGDLDHPQAIAAALEGSDAVIYNVGILREYPHQGITFDKLQHRGVVDVIGAARAAGIERFLLMSANGVDQAHTDYQRTKLAAEEAVRASGLDFTIFRPSVIFGDPHGNMEFATQLYQDMIRVPIPAAGFFTGISPAHGQLLMSPVHVRDVADAFVNALDNDATTGQCYEIGGPETLSWTDMLRRIAAATGRRKLILPMPIGIMKLAAAALDWLPFFPVTRDQLTMLAAGNTADSIVFSRLIGREPLAFTPEQLAYLAPAAS